MNDSVKVPTQGGFDWLETFENNPEDILEQNQEAMKAALNAQLETAKMIREVMTDGRGPEFMDWLEGMTRRAPLLKVSSSIPVGNEIALSPADWAYIRAGQNSVLEELERMIHLATVQPNEEPQQENQAEQP